MCPRPGGSLLPVRTESDGSRGIGPRTDEEWISIKVLDSGSVESVLARYRQYMTEFIAAVPRPARGRIQLSYGIA